jgi:hypothetical protein
VPLPLFTQSVYEFRLLEINQLSKISTNKSVVKQILFYFFLLASTQSIGQEKGISDTIHSDTAKVVSFIVRFHISNLDKDDAAILNGYVVNIGYERAKKINGKRIRITGKVVLKKSPLNRPPGTPVYQQREGPYMYIESPEIVVVKY